VEQRIAYAPGLLENEMTMSGTWIWYDECSDRAVPKKLVVDMNDTGKN
jgi:hypothetical protein